MSPRPRTYLLSRLGITPPSSPVATQPRLQSQSGGVFHCHARFRWAGWLLRLVWLVAMLNGAYWLFSDSVFPAKPQYRLVQIGLQLPSGGSIVLGREELAAPAAGLRHVRVWREASGTWWLVNVSRERAVAWTVDGHGGQLRQLRMQAGQALWVAGTAWEVKSTRPHLVLIQPDLPDRAWRYDGARLWHLSGAGAAELVTSAEAQAGYPNANSAHVSNLGNTTWAPAPHCLGLTWPTRLRQAWNQVLPPGLAWPAPLQWGGSLPCSTRLAQAAVPLGGLVISLRAGEFHLSAEAAVAQRVCLQALQEGTCPPGKSLYEQALPLTEGMHLTLGRTTFALHMQGDTLLWEPLRRGGWVQAEHIPSAAQFETASTKEQVQLSSPAASVSWTTLPYSLWQLPAWLALPWIWAMGGATVAALAAWLHLHHRQPQRYAAIVAVAVVMVLCSFGLWHVGATAGPGISLLWLCLALAAVVLMPGATGWAWGSHALLASMLLLGAALQWQLGQQASDTGAWLVFQKTAALGAMGLYLLLALAWWLHGRQSDRRPPTPRSGLFWDSALLAGGLSALIALAAQVVWGGEEGVFGIQPVELAKLALVVLGAHALTVRLEWQQRQGLWSKLLLWLRLLAPIALFVGLGGLALLMVQDYSPLVLIGLWLLGVVWAWAAASGSWRALALGFLGLGLVLTGWAWLQMGNGAAWMASHGFYGERFAVWLEPQTHPHSGEQLMRAWQLADQGGWWGQVEVNGWRVPAVQDDMAPSFLVGRYGLASAVVLWALQLGYLACLLMLGWQALRQGSPGQHQRRWALRLVFFAAWGASALFAGHLLLSWGTNTGWLPVMGQPMPLVSAGGSVLVLLLTPLHLLWQLQAHLVGGPRQ